MTANDFSDLRALHADVIQRSLEQQAAATALKAAQANLESFLWKLEHPAPLLKDVKSSLPAEPTAKE